MKNCVEMAIRKRKRLKTPALLFLSLLCSFIIFSQFLITLPTHIISDSLEHEDNAALLAKADVNFPVCSLVSNGTICCDRSSIRSDICIVKGDVRTHSPTSSLYLYTSNNIKDVANYVPDKNEDASKLEREEQIQHEKIKPYTRKWEANTMSTIDELHLISKNKNIENKFNCQVNHDVPAVFFSTGGYTGNVYHEFNDGILPLYITSQHLKKRVMFVILDYHKWWYRKYRDIISQLSDFPPIDFRANNKVHCFPEAIVGLRIHSELTIDPSLMEGGKTIQDFRAFVDKSYSPRIRDEDLKAKTSQNLIERRKEGKTPKLNPKLVIIARKGSRVIENQNLLVRMAEKIGFQVEVLTPTRTSELSNIYRVLNYSDVMIGVHGAALTHLLFMRPGSVFIQVVPLGTDWAAETYYGEPALKLGLKYVAYKIHLRESSLYDKYPKDDIVLTDPYSIVRKGWEFTKKVYLSDQNVRLNLVKFRKRLVQAYDYTLDKKNLLQNQ